jgi:hypothetical protein
MSNSSKIIIGVVAVAILAFIGWWFMGNSSSGIPANVPVAMVPQQNDQLASQSQVAINVPPVAGLSTKSKDSSDAALSSDISAVSAQIDGLSADNASVDSSLSASTK